MQTGAHPRLATTAGDPNAPLDLTRYHRAVQKKLNIATPPETYQYEAAYEALTKDKEFRERYGIIDFAKKTDSISEDNAAIRVVIRQTAKSQGLLPCTYTPGGLDAQSVPGLPPGYSIALEVYVLEEAKTLLDHQRAFRNGAIEKRLEWLDKIVQREYGHRYDSLNVEEEPLQALRDAENAPPMPRAKQRAAPASRSYA